MIRFTHRRSASVRDAQPMKRRKTLTNSNVILRLQGERKAFRLQACGKKTNVGNQEPLRHYDIAKLTLSSFEIAYYSRVLMSSKFYAQANGLLSFHRYSKAFDSSHTIEIFFYKVSKIAIRRPWPSHDGKCFRSGESWIYMRLIVV
jgi:hypothetical protein